jgi:hypothetical protein
MRRSSVLRLKIRRLACTTASTDKNVVEVSLSADERLLVGMDFNVNPMTAVVAQRSGDQCHVIDEIVLSNSNTQQMMQEIDRRYGGCEGVVHPDPSAKSRKTSAPAGETDLTIIERAGWPVYRNSPYKVVDRINSVNSMLLNAQGSRRLLSPRRARQRSALWLSVSSQRTELPKVIDEVRRKGLRESGDSVDPVCGRSSSAW